MSGDEATTRERVLPGILIEGLNYSGKTTVANLVIEMLEKEATSVDAGRCYVSGAPEVSGLQERAFASLVGPLPDRFPDADFMRTFNALRSAQMIADAELASPVPPTLRVQDRYWFTQHCNNEFFTPDGRYLSPYWIAHQAPRFTVQVYLTCTQEAREHRSRERVRPESHRLNEYQRAHVGRFPAFDEVARGLATATGFDVIDTTELDAVAVARDLMDRLRRGLGLTGGARLHRPSVSAGSMP